MLCLRLVLEVKFLCFLFSINKESIIDINADVVAVQNKIESCTEQTLELFINEIYVISEAKAQLPLQIEDASRPELSGVSLCYFFVLFLE